MTEPLATEPTEEPVERVTTMSLAEAIGGGRGLFDSGVPATVFVLTRVLSHHLSTAIVVAILSGVAIVGLRLVRKQPTQQAFSGLFGLGLAVAVAAYTGKGKGFFLPGILLTAGWGVATAVSVALRRPLVGVVLGALDHKYADWREHPPLFRACQVSTVIWSVTLFIRAGVATVLYRMKGDHDLALLIVGNAVKWPLILGAAGATLLLCRRAIRDDAATT